MAEEIIVKLDMSQKRRLRVLMIQIDTLKKSMMTISENIDKISKEIEDITK